MSMATNSDLTDRTKTVAERLEKIDDPEEFDDPIEVKVTANIDGTLREIIAVLSTGGPGMEVNLTKGTITGSWSSKTYTTHIQNEDVLAAVEARYEELWRANT